MIGHSSTATSNGQKGWRQATFSRMVNWLAMPVKLCGDPSQLCWQSLVNKLAICRKTTPTRNAPIGTEEASTRTGLSDSATRHGVVRHSRTGTLLPGQGPGSKVTAYFVGRRSSRNHAPETIRGDLGVVRQLLTFIGQPLWEMTEDDFECWAAHLSRDRKLAPENPA